MAVCIYFSIPRATVQITPELVIRTVGKNIVFAENPDEASIFQSTVVGVREITRESSWTQTYTITTIDEFSVNLAQGELEVINELQEPIVLRPRTRFQTDDGLVYRSTDWVRIPAASKD